MPKAMRLRSDFNRLSAKHVILVLALLFTAVAVQAQGIDVSKYQGKINWTKVSKSKKVKFVYIRATEGASIRDSYYKANVDSARKAGILVGSYHVYSSKTTAYQQFANFKAVAVKKKQDLVPVLDIEGHHSGRLNMKRVDKLLERLWPKVYDCIAVGWVDSDLFWNDQFADRRRINCRPIYPPC